VFVVDSDERRAYEQGKREQAMARTRAQLAALQRRVASGALTEPSQIGAAAERALRMPHGYRYFGWQLRAGQFAFFDHPVHLEREKRLEGKFVIASSEQGWGPADAVATYQQLLEVERGFRDLKDVLAVRPIYQRAAPRVRAHIGVAALARLVRTLLERRLQEGGVARSSTEALQAVATIRHVTFQVPGGERRGVSAASPRASDVLRALGIRDLRPPTPPADEREVV
jgi:hypothetical protein